MRVFEIILIITLLARVLLTFTEYRRTKNLRATITLLATAVAFAQFYLEGWRWQLTPFYLAVFVALTVDLTRFPSDIEDLEGGRSIRRALLGILGLAFFTAIAFLLPVPSLPRPTGQALVGTFSFELTDRTRPEIYSAEEADRRMIVRVWYPASSKTKRAPWIENSEQMLPALARAGGLPAWMLNHLQYIRTHSYWAAPVQAQDMFPVVLFDHGLWGYRSQNTFLVEDLASHGYVVFAVEHPYGAAQSVFQDGTITTYHEAVLPDSSDPTYDAATRRLTNQWLEDNQFLLDYLAAAPTLEVNGLSDHLDLNRVALTGHSTGGSSVLSFCALDDRCATFVTFDAWMKAVSDDAVAQGLPQAALNMFSDLQVGYFPEENQERYLDILASSDNSKTLFIANTGHHDFDDTAFLSPVARFFGHSKGGIRPKRAFEIIRAYTLAQLDSELLGEEVTLLSENPSPYEEVSFAYEKAILDASVNEINLEETSGSDRE